MTPTEEERKTVLIVDDEPKNIRLFHDLTQVAGYRTLEASNGRIGVELAKAELPDLILMDIQMPVMDGLTAVRLLKSLEETKHIPIMALTSYAMKGDRERMLEAGCDCYMAKPIDIHEFMAHVHECLGKPYRET